MFFKKKLKKEEIEKRVNTVTPREKILKYINLILGCLIVTITFNVMFKPQNIVYGGVAGISIIVENLWGINASLFLVVSYVILLILSFILLGWKDTKGSLLGSILFPILIYLTSDLAKIIGFNATNKLLLSIVGGTLTGVGLGLTFKSGFTSGGSDVVVSIMAKFLHIPIGKSMLIFNSIVIAASTLLLRTPTGAIDWSNLIYSVITLYVITLVTDKVILGVSKSKSFHVITEHDDEIKGYIMGVLNHGVTILEAKGGYTGDKQKVIMCIVPTREYYKIKQDILKIDPRACVLVTDAYEFTGGK